MVRGHRSDHERHGLNLSLTDAELAAQARANTLENFACGLRPKVLRDIFRRMHANNEAIVGMISDDEAFAETLRSTTSPQPRVPDLRAE